MQMKSILRVKRDGKELTREQIEFWVKGISDKSIPDYQSSAMLMAIFHHGMNIRERSDLTLAMSRSGSRMDLRSLGSFVIDKHSSGGIGDKTSLMLAPAMAAFGLKVPMISGRGLGFTGGTLDKLHSLPGFTHELSEARRMQILQSHGAFIGGQTSEIAPADRTLYALRDVTETVEEISLITASILSKKFTEDLDALVLDIKCGSGAFMSDLEKARELADSLVKTSQAAGIRCHALITRMNFPLGAETGNLNEVIESLQYLSPGSQYYEVARQHISVKDHIFSHAPVSSAIDNLVFVTQALMIEMLAITGKFSAEEAHGQILSKWASGELLQKYKEILSEQGVDWKEADDLIHNFNKQREKKSIPVLAQNSGFLVDCNGASLGNLMVELGAGRKKAEDSVNPQVSFTLKAWENKPVMKGEIIGSLFAEENSNANSIAEKISETFTITESKDNDIHYIYDRLAN
ncbi:MAG: thymidine phosphorylase [Leptospiraceae bacterium]|nr:thymidine phosphorylase [Leptospiraceae bacterium]